MKPKKNFPAFIFYNIPHKLRFFDTDADTMTAPYSSATRYATQDEEEEETREPLRFTRAPKSISTQSQSFFVTFNGDKTKVDNTYRVFKTQAEQAIKDNSVNGLLYAAISVEDGYLTNNHHFHVALHFNSLKRMTTVINQLPCLKGGHFELRAPTATWNETVDYFKLMNSVEVKKGAAPVFNPSFWQHGVFPKDEGPAARRAGNKKGGDQMAEKWKLIKHLAETNQTEMIPSDVYIRYYSTLKKIAAASMPIPGSRKAMVDLWLTGRPGIGKSSYADQFAAANGWRVFRKPMNKWWCGYTGEQVVVIEDVDKTSIIEHKMVNSIKVWCDHAPFSVEIKGGQMTIRPDLICFTSNHALDDCIENSEDRDAILRRLTQVTVGVAADETCFLINCADNKKLASFPFRLGKRVKYDASILQAPSIMKDKGEEAALLTQTTTTTTTPHVSPENMTTPPSRRNGAVNPVGNTLQLRTAPGAPRANIYVRFANVPDTQPLPPSPHEVINVDEDSDDETTLLSAQTPPFITRQRNIGEKGLARGSQPMRRITPYVIRSSGHNVFDSDDEESYRSSVARDEEDLLSYPEHPTAYTHAPDATQVENWRATVGDDDAYSESGTETVGQRRARLTAEIDGIINSPRSDYEGYGFT